MEFAENNRISHRQLYRQMILGFLAPFWLCMSGRGKLNGVDAVIGTVIAVVLLCFYVVFLIRLAPAFEDLKKTAGAFMGRVTGAFFLLFILLAGGYLLATHGAFFALVTFLPIYFGAASAQAIVESVPAWILGGLGVAGGMMPAIGFAMLLKIMLKKEYIAFLLAGFVLVTYFNISILGLAVLGACIAMYDFYANGQDKGGRNMNEGVRQRGGI